MQVVAREARSDWQVFSGLDIGGCLRTLGSSFLGIQWDGRRLFLDKIRQGGSLGSLREQGGEVCRRKTIMIN